jgi:hypothetical protein
MRACGRSRIFCIDRQQAIVCASQRLTRQGACDGIADRIRNHRVHLAADLPQVMPIHPPRPGCDVVLSS